MVFNATFNNISVISWRSVLLEEETGENHRPAASHWQTLSHSVVSRRVWRYQRGNQNPYIEEEQITQWPKVKVQNGKQRSTKHTYKTKDRVTRTSLKTRVELRCPRRTRSSCFTYGTHRVTLVTNTMIKHNEERTGLWLRQTYPWSFVSQILTTS